jgi:GntP family gluconate:H+ symporter
MPEAVEPAWSAGVLLLIAAVGVLTLLFLIMKVKLHAFLALILVSLGVALAARIPLGDVVTTLTTGFGTTLASVALLVGLGAMLGRLLEFSGGAQVLADSLINRFGEQRAPLALGVAALLFGFPIFFDAGLVVFLPIVFTVARRLGGSLLTYGLPVAGAFAVMHAFVPPHPGPVAAAELVGADIGLVLVFGLLIGLPTWYLGGYLFGTWAGRRYHVAVPDLLSTGGGTAVAPAPATPGGGSSRRVGGGGAAGDTPDTAVAGTAPGLAEPSGGARAAQATGGPPTFGTVLALLLLPLVLIFLNTGMNTLVTAGAVEEDALVARLALLIGSTPDRAAHHRARGVVRPRHPPRHQGPRGRVDRQQRPRPGLRDHPHHRCGRHVRRRPARERDRQALADVLRTSACRSSSPRSSSPCCCGRAGLGDRWRLTTAAGLIAPW